MSRPITYQLAIDCDRSGRPYVAYERLRQRRKGQVLGKPFSFLWMEDGRGEVWKGQSPGRQLGENDPPPSVLEKVFSKLMGDDEESSKREYIHLQDKRKLGIATLGALQQHPRIAAFREFIEGWYLSYFTPDAARSLPMAGPEQRLNMHGDNLSNVVQYLEREHPNAFEGILERIASRVPGIDRIDTEQSPDGRLLLRFNDRGFQEPFYAQQVSDGTLKVFAYLLLLADPNPPPFICIEEPENGLYHKLLEVLADEFRTRTRQGKNRPQIFITTHQPYLLDALSPDEAWILEKQPDGFSTIRRASDDDTVTAMADEGLPLGGLWYSDYLD